MSKRNMPAGLYIIVAAALWGCIGVFFNIMAALGLNSMQVVFLRLACAGVAFTLFLAATGRTHLLKFSPRDAIYFIGTGIFSLVFFNWCNFNAIEQSSMAVAAVLLYTSPVWIMLLAAIFFHEKLTPQKLLALLLTLVGCALVVGLLGDAEARLSAAAVLYGLGAGFGYALYSIFGKFALAKYSAEAVSAHTFNFGAVGALPLAAAYGWTPAYLSPTVWLCTLALGVLCCILPYLLYTKGLQQVEAGKAAILATAEPAVATLFSVLLYHEPLSADKICGMLLIVGAILLLNVQKTPRQTAQI